MAPKLPPISLSPFCRHLASKKLLLGAGPPRTDQDILDASCHTWCEQTQEALGPDQEPTDAEDCRQGRTCFEPYNR